MITKDYSVIGYQDEQDIILSRLIRRISLVDFDSTYQTLPFNYLKLSAFGSKS